MKRTILLLLVALSALAAVIALVVVFPKAQRTPAPAILPQQQTVVVPAAHVATASSAFKNYLVPVLPTPFLPTIVSVYEFRYPRDLLATAKTIASWFLITNEPTVAQLADGTLYIFSQGEVSLSVGLDPVTISYSAYPKVGLTTLSSPDTFYSQQANQFIQKNKLLPPGATLSSPTIEYLAPRGNDPNYTTRDKATSIKISYRLLLSGRPLYTHQSGNSTISITYDSTNTLEDFTGFYFSGIVDTKKTTNVLSQTEAVSRLQTNQGVLAWIEAKEDVNKEGASTYSFSAVDIKKISLGYYYTPRQPLLAPVYVFDGNTTDQKNRKIDTITIVSAL